MQLFFSYYSEFDWRRQVLTVQGAVPHGMLQQQAQPPGSGDQVADKLTSRPSSSSVDKIVSFTIDKYLFLYKDFALKTQQGKSWVHVGGPNIQDPIDYGNNMGKSVSADNLDQTVLAFRFAREHLKMLLTFASGKAEGSSGFSTPKGPPPPWTLGVIYPFLWPSNLMTHAPKVGDKNMYKGENGAKEASREAAS